MLEAPGYSEEDREHVHTALMLVRVGGMSPRIMEHLRILFNRARIWDEDEVVEDSWEEIEAGRDEDGDWPLTGLAA